VNLPLPITLDEVPQPTRDWLMAQAEAEGCSPQDLVVALLDQRAEEDGVREGFPCLGFAGRENAISTGGSVVARKGTA